MPSIASGLTPREESAVSTFRLPLLKRLFSARLLAGLDAALQAPTSPLHLSPSIFLRAESVKPGAPTLSDALWRCVQCGEIGLEPSPATLTCRQCHAAYPIVDGIIDFKSGTRVE